MNIKKRYERRYSNKMLIDASSKELFDYIDEHKSLSSHMNKSSWMMAGRKMKTLIDEKYGKKIGSHIMMKGKIFGTPIFLDEIITKRIPPRLKEWETIGDPKLIVIGKYNMKVEIKSKKNKSLLKVSINYNLPEKNKWLGKILGKIYAKWCVNQIIKDAKRHFSVM